MLTLFSCKTKSIDDNYDKKTFDEDIKALVEKKAISDIDKVLLTSYIVTKQEDTAALSKSYKLLLVEAKTIEQTRKQKEAKQKELNDQLVITLKNKKVIPVFRDGIINNEIILTATFKNKSDRTINGFAFRLNFTNANGESMGGENWTMDNTVSKQSEKTVSFSAGVFDNTNEGLVKLKIADLSKIKTEYIIMKLLFSDGTTIETN